MNQQQQQILARIAKLIAHSKSAEQMGSLEEAATFAAKANDLLLEYNLSMADVNALNEQKADPFANWKYSETISYKDNQSGSKWRYMLMQTLVEHNFCNFTFQRALKQLRVYGDMQNVDVVVWMYHFISMGLLRLAQQAHVNLPPEQKSLINRYAFLKNYLIGAVKGIGDKLEAQRIAQYKSHAGTYALIKTNDIQLKAFVTKTQPDIKSSSGIKSSTTLGFGAAQGYKAGRDFNITQPLPAAKPSTIKLLS